MSGELASADDILSAARMKADDVAAFAYLALSGDLSGEGNAFDHHLAADYLRLCEKDTPEARYSKRKVSLPPLPHKRFFVYNYGAAGIFRRSDWMVTLKGYTTDVWGSEIYRKDNRYGRYQSYGSVQIMGYPHAFPAVTMRTVGIGIAYRELQPSTYHSNCWIARYRELPWHIPKKISQAVVHWKGKTACL